jgi:uncharacterized protein
MPTEALRIEIPHAGVDEVSAILDMPEDDPGGPVILLAHGAGAGMESTFMQTVGQGLALAGFPTLRFHYAYTERMSRGENRRPPDRRPVLEKVHEAARSTLMARYPERKPVFAGKSMGGRMASYLAAEGADCAALVFFGYPLHPAGNPEKLRTEHFPTLAQPAMFLTGTRDALCDLELLRPALETYGGRTSLEIVEDADHDFAVPRRTGRSRSEVMLEVVDRASEWIRATLV